VAQRRAKEASFGLEIFYHVLPVHFPRYQLEREADCVEFQSALLELLRRIPLTCEAERWVTDHWLYFYECSIGCVGILKDWLLRAVSTALDDGLARLSLDCVQDHALPVDINRQMALDAYEGEQRLNHTASNREHVWRLLQGGELIAPVPPLPPRETSSEISVGSVGNTLPQLASSETAPAIPAANDEAAPAQPVKKTRSRKKVGADPATTESGNTVQTSKDQAEVKPSLTRGRKKKTAEPPVETASAPEVSEPASMDGNAPSMPTDSETAATPLKPKRTRRVGEPKPKRYPVGEQERES
jgi:hypothetical protein